MKKGLQEWMKELEENKGLAKQVQEMKDPKEIVKIAHENGYEITEDELMDAVLESVSGGGGILTSTLKKCLGRLIETCAEGIQEIGKAAVETAGESLERTVKEYLK